jgi:putative endonuclease
VAIFRGLLSTVIAKERSDCGDPYGSTVMSNQYYVNIITNKNNTVLYTGVTNDLKSRTNEHMTKAYDGITARYNVNKLVYYEVADSPESAIAREKQIKKGPRNRKMKLINSFNPDWRDLYEDI